MTVRTAVTITCCSRLPKLVELKSITGNRAGATFPILRSQKKPALLSSTRAWAGHGIIPKDAFIPWLMGLLLITSWMFTLLQQMAYANLTNMESYSGSTTPCQLPLWTRLLSIKGPFLLATLWVVFALWVWLPASCCGTQTSPHRLAKTTVLPWYMRASSSRPPIIGTLPQWDRQTNLWKLSMSAMERLCGPINPIPRYGISCHCFQIGNLGLHDDTFLPWELDGRERVVLLVYVWTTALDWHDFYRRMIQLQILNVEFILLNEVRIFESVIVERLCERQVRSHSPFRFVFRTPLYSKTWAAECTEWLCRADFFGRQVASLGRGQMEGLHWAMEWHLDCTLIHTF